MSAPGNHECDCERLIEKEDRLPRAHEQHQAQAIAYEAWGSARRAVRELLDVLPSEAVRSAVVFTGSAEFKAGVPEGVYDLSGIVDYIRQQRHESMSLNRMQFCIGRLEAMRLAISGVMDVEHVKSLERRHGRSA